MEKPTARKCELCGKPKGCFAFSVYENGKQRSGYWHPACHTKFKQSLKEG